MRVSVIIPTYNEEKVIADCIQSLFNQTYKDTEIIIVDDGSTDKTLEVVNRVKGERERVMIFKQDHLGPGMARNLGAKEAKGEILVFVDADMTFDEKFIVNLIKPIANKRTIGTFSKEEFVANKDNVWSKCWNINKGLPTNRMHPKDYPEKQPVFRAILKNEFMGVKGFDPIGYIDDYTLSKKLDTQALAAPNAIFYHRNPETLQEVFVQARWVGKNEFKNRKVKNENLMRAISIVRYSLPFSIANGFSKGIANNLIFFVIFKIIYDLAVEISLIKSFFNEGLYK